MDQIGVLRTEWLTQIADAIESAQRLAWQLRTQEGASGQARAELESLSAGGDRSRVTETDWLRALGWSGLLGDPDS